MNILDIILDISEQANARNYVTIDDSNTVGLRLKYSDENNGEKISHLMLIRDTEFSEQYQWVKYDPSIINRMFRLHDELVKVNDKLLINDYSNNRLMFDSIGGIFFDVILSQCPADNNIYCIVEARLSYRDSCIKNKLSFNINYLIITLTFCELYTIFDATMYLEVTDSLSFHYCTVLTIDEEALLCSIAVCNTNHFETLLSYLERYEKTYLKYNSSILNYMILDHNDTSIDINVDAYTYNIHVDYANDMILLNRDCEPTSFKYPIILYKQFIEHIIRYFYLQHNLDLTGHFTSN